MLLCNAIEPLQNVIDKSHHDGEFGLAHERPLTERLRFLAQDGVVTEAWLVDLDTDDHVDVLLVVPLRDESLDWSDCLDINISIDTAINIHDEVSEQISLDDLCSELAVGIDDVRSIETFRAKVRFNIVHVVVVGQNFISVLGVLRYPALCGIQVSFVESQRVNLPSLPDFAGKLFHCWGSETVRIIAFRLGEGTSN